MNISLNREEIPLGIAGTGKLNVAVDVEDPRLPLPKDHAELMDIKFSVAGTQPLTFGKPGTATLTINANSEAKLKAIFPHSTDPDDVSLLGEYQIGDAPNDPDLLMTLRLGAAADAGLSANITYEALSVQGSVNTGVDGGYTLIKPYPQTKPVGEMVTDFLKQIRMPASAADALAEGELIAYEFGGYLRLAASVSAGYEMQGAHSFELGDLQLSEKYSFGLMGTVGIHAAVAGRFGVEVRGVAAPADSPGRWIRVTARRKRSTEAGVAADVSLHAASQLNGLPQSSDEFLGALLGVTARSWLKYIETVEAAVAKAGDATGLEQLGDDLAKKFLSQLVNKGIDQIGPELDTVLPTLKKIVDTYENLGDRAVALFDRYFDRIDVLVQNLTTVKTAASWSDLFKGIVNPDLARVVETLLGGDPLQFATGIAGSPDTALTELQKAADKVLGSIQNKAHEEILGVIQQVKQQFGLDPLFSQLDSIDTVDKLKAKADDLAGAFASRLIGKAIASVDPKELNAILKRIQLVVAQRRLFQDRIYAKFLDLANQSFELSLHAEYNRASDNAALIDVLLNLDEEVGRQLVGPAAECDFSGIMQAYRPPEHPSDPDPTAGFRPNAVRILNGSLTHSTRRESAFKVNVNGWHRDYTYEGVDRVIVNTEQQIEADSSGALTVHTVLELQKEKERRSGLTASQERIYTNFVLRILGESKGAVEFDKDNHQFLIDVITSMSARYNLEFQDPKTTPEELAYYLSFARDFGLAGEGATVEKLAPALPQVTPGNFGPVDAAYEVVFTEAGINRLLTARMDEDTVRSVMRNIVLTNYLREKSPFLADVAWCYATAGLSAKLDNNDFNSSGRTIRGISAPGFAQRTGVPQSVNLNHEQLQVLRTLYAIEDSVVSALDGLVTALNRQPAAPDDIHKALDKFGSALKEFDDFDEGVNTVFAVLDQLIRANGGETLRGSMLRLKSQVAGKDVEKVFAKVAPQVAAAGGGRG